MAQTSFFILPLELRQMIYHLALLPVPSDVYNFNSSTIFVNIFHMANTMQLSANYWSSPSLQRRLSLLYVNKQVHDEVTHVLYTFFNFCFPHSESPCYANKLHEWLTVEARTKISKIRLTVALPMAQNPGGNHRGALLGSQCLQVLGETLLGLKSVRLAIHFEGEPVQREDFEYLVQCVLGTVRPFRHVTELLLENFDAHRSQRRRIYGECESRIRAGGEWWKVPDAAPVNPLEL